MVQQKSTKKQHLSAHFQPDNQISCLKIARASKGSTQQPCQAIWKQTFSWCSHGGCREAFNCDSAQVDDHLMQNLLRTWKSDSLWWRRRLSAPNSFSNSCIKSRTELNIYTLTNCIAFDHVTKWANSDKVSNTSADSFQVEPQWLLNLSLCFYSKWCLLHLPHNHLPFWKECEVAARLYHWN